MLDDSDVARAFELLGTDRAGFVRFAPTLGITKTTAQRVFGSPRRIEVCFATLDAFAYNCRDGKCTPLDQLVQLAEQHVPPATKPRRTLAGLHRRA